MRDEGEAKCRGDLGLVSLGVNGLRHGSEGRWNREEGEVLGEVEGEEGGHFGIRVVVGMRAEDSVGVVDIYCGR